MQLSANHAPDSITHDVHMRDVHNTQDVVVLYTTHIPVPCERDTLGDAIIHIPVPLQASPRGSDHCSMHDILREWERITRANGIFQHAPEWHKARCGVIGGSSMAVITGDCPYRSIADLVYSISQQIHKRDANRALLSNVITHTDTSSIVSCANVNCTESITSIHSDTMTSIINAGGDQVCAMSTQDTHVDVLLQTVILTIERSTIVAPGNEFMPAAWWGILFEPVAKRHTECLYKCTILGDDLFIRGPPGTAYSPDGLAVIGNKIVLLEFKCPYSRIPRRSPPAGYVPQVKMGLDLIPIADSGLLMEFVFRRCAWEDMSNGTYCREPAAQIPRGSKPQYCGFVAFLARDDRPLSDEFRDIYAEMFGGTAMMDIGPCPRAGLEAVLGEFAAGRLQPWYSKTLPFGTSPEDELRRLCAEVDGGRDGCADVVHTLHAADAENVVRIPHVTCIAILPWKLYHIAQHTIMREPGFVAKWQKKIDIILELATQCAGMTPSEVQHVVDGKFYTADYIEI